jgi:hypothetical protein
MEDQPEFIPIEESPGIPTPRPVLQPPVIAAPRQRPPGPDLLSEARGLARFIYTHNPFYVISSALIFAGLWRSFGDDPEMFEAGAMTLGLAAFTLVLAATSVLVIRYGNVWDDARSLLLLIVLMFLGISVTSDPVLNAEGRPGVWFMLGGLLLAVGVSEGVLRAVRLSLPLLYRGPYYLVLALFFLYPLAVSPLLKSPPGARLYWALFAFSPLGGLAFLTLLPAMRRGARYVRDNGSPWRWPQFPWILFGTLGFCVCLRAYYVCVSFHAILGTESIFGLYFLVPFWLAVNVLLLEGSIVSGSRRLARFVLAAPLALPLVSMVGDAGNQQYAEFLNVFAQTLGASPAFAALAAVGAFYLYAALRGVAGASSWFSAAAAAMSVVGPGTFDLRGLTDPSPLPLLVAALPQAWIAVVRRESLRLSLAAGLLVGASVLALEGTWFVAWHGALPAHLMLVCVLVAGAVFDDAAARLLRLAAAGAMLLSCLMVTAGDSPFVDRAPIAVRSVYPLALVAVALVYGYLVDKWPFFAAAATGACGWVIVSVGSGYRILQQHVVGLNEILCGAACFVLAAAISAAKTGVAQRWHARRRGRLGERSGP